MSVDFNRSGIDIEPPFLACLGENRMCQRLLKQGPVIALDEGIKRFWFRISISEAGLQQGTLRFQYPHQVYFSTAGKKFRAAEKVIYIVFAMPIPLLFYRRGFFLNPFRNASLYCSTTSWKPTSSERAPSWSSIIWKYSCMKLEGERMSTQSVLKEGE